MSIHISHLSPSQINTICDCGMRYYWRYVQRKIIPPAFVLIKGKGVHEGAQEHWRHKLRTGRNLSRKNIVDCSVAAYEKELDERGVYIPPSVAKGKAAQDRLLNDGVKSVRTLAGVFSDKLAPAVAPAYVEQPCEFDFWRGVKMRMRIDLVDEAGRLRDLKTMARNNLRRAHTDSALTCYSMAYEREFKKPPTAIIYDGLIETQKPYYAQEVTQRSRADYDRFLLRAATVLRTIETGIYLPAAAGWWGCSEKYCGYWSMCPYGGGRAGDGHDK